MSQEVTMSELEWLRIQISRSTNDVEIAKMRKELEEKEAIFDRMHYERLKEIENDGKGLVGPR